MNVVIIDRSGKLESRRARRRGGWGRAAIALTCAALLTLAACSSDDGEDDASATSSTTSAVDDGGSSDETQELRVGALLSITGPGSSLGANTEAALTLATDEWNSYLESQGDDIEVVLDVEDTELDPELAVSGFESLAERGASIVIGPQSSSEVAEIAGVVEDGDVLVVSHGSTASSLAGVSSKLFRYVPTDVVEGQATVDLMAEQGIATVVPVSRDDAGNEGLASSVSAAAAGSGITAAEGVTYSPDTTDFAPVLDELAAQLAGVADPSTTAVYLAGFAETADLLAAAADAGLPDVSWYGGDGAAQAEQLLEGPGAAFAATHGGFPSPLVALPPDQAGPNADLIERVEGLGGEDVDAFALAAYDAFNVAVEAALGLGPDAGIDELVPAFVTLSDQSVGATGPIELDEAGDRTTAPFAFWSICEEGGSASWVRTALWTPGDPGGPGTITPGSCESPVTE